MTKSNIEKLIERDILDRRGMPLNLAMRKVSKPLSESQIEKVEYLLIVKPFKIVNGYPEISVFKKHNYQGTLWIETYYRYDGERLESTTYNPNCMNNHLVSEEIESSLKSEYPVYVFFNSVKYPRMTFNARKTKVPTRRTTTRKTASRKTTNRKTVRR